MAREPSIILMTADPLVLRAQFLEAQAELDRAVAEEAMLMSEMRTFALDPAAHVADLRDCQRALSQNKQRIKKAQEEIQCLTP